MLSDFSLDRRHSGLKIKFKVNRRVSDEERADIANDKLRELRQRQSA